MSEPFKDHFNLCVDACVFFFYPSHLLKKIERAFLINCLLRRRKRNFVFH